MRLAFLGTPDFAVPTLAALLEAGHDVAAVYSQPPRPAGRGKVPRASPVQHFAQARGLLVHTPSSLKGEEEQRSFAGLGLDTAVVAAYGLILPPPILAAPRRGCLNVHASLLPRWRGAAPIQRAILAGDETTGVCIMKMEVGLDTGPVYACREQAIGTANAGELTHALAAKGAALMIEVLAGLDRLEPVPQPDEGVTYAAKITKEEARLRFAEPAEAVLRQVRAFASAPGAWFEHRGERIRVLEAGIDDRAGPPGMTLDAPFAIACATGSLVPHVLQRAGRAALPSAELLRGFPLPPGTRLA